jgi:ATP-dependent Clp endopeptidase proteolytic subunit ClpP
MQSWYTIRALASGAQGSRTQVLIYDEIGAYGVSAKGFLAELSALPEGTGLDLRINSPGGSVFDAVAIFNALKRHDGEVTVWIDGIAASAASYIAMAGDTVIMPENAFLMIHDPSGLVMGTAEDMRATAEALDKVKTSLIQGYAGKSGKSDEDIAALMAAETWLDAKDALELGLIDQIAAPVKLVAAFDIARFRNAPPELVEAVAEPIADAVEETNAPADSAAPLPDAATSNTPQSDAVAFNIPEPATVPAPDAKAIRAEAISHARAVIDLCRLAGQPQMAGRFLEEGRGIDEIRSTLLAAKAEAEPEITSAHAQPGRASSTQAWGDVIARTFHKKG